MSTGLTTQVKTIRDLLAKSKEQIEMALPSHMTPERMIRVAMTCIQKSPQLSGCDPRSLVAAIIEASQLGLEPDGILGHAYLVPFKNKNGANMCQLIPGYKGLIDLARRSGNISTIDVHEVRTKDKFEFAFGLEPTLRHIPAPLSERDRGDLTHFYAVARLRDGGVQFAVMHKSEVDAIRGRSRASSSGPWVTDYVAMGKKTVLRQLVKLLPVSVEAQRAVAIDESDDTSRPMEISPTLSIDLPDLAPPMEEPEPEFEPESLPTSMARDMDELADRIASGRPAPAAPPKKPAARRKALREEEPEPLPVPVPEISSMSIEDRVEEWLTEMAMADTQAQLDFTRAAVSKAANEGLLDHTMKLRIQKFYDKRSAEMSGDFGDR